MAYGGMAQGSGCGPKLLFGAAPITGASRHRAGLVFRPRVDSLGSEKLTSVGFRRPPHQIVPILSELGVIDAS